jgi:hypothetical protein
MFQLSPLERREPCPPFLGSGTRDMQQSQGESEQFYLVIAVLPRHLGRIEPLGNLNVNFCSVTKATLSVFCTVHRIIIINGPFHTPNPNAGQIAVLFIFP